MKRGGLFALPLVLMFASCGTVNRPDDGGPDGAMLDANSDAVEDATDAIDGAMDGDSGAMHSACRDGNFVLAFDGNQLVVVPDSSFLRPSGSLTLEAWVRFDGTPLPYNSIAIKTVGTTSNDSYALWYDSTGLRASINLDSGSHVAYAWTPVLRQWYFLTFSFDIATHVQRLYIDGIEVASNVKNETPSYDNHPLTIGSDYGGNMATGLFVGRIDEVRLFGVARTPQQIASDQASCSAMGLQDLLAYWRFNEGTGQYVQDASGNGNRGTLGPTEGAAGDDPAWIASDAPFP